MAEPKGITYKVSENGCHICTSHKANSYGYFQISINGKQVLIHRFIYEEKFGTIKPGNIIRHTCDNPNCINPDHLLEGTQKDNMQDAVDRNRTAKGITHGRAKLNEQQVLEIFNNTVDTHRALGRKYNTDCSTIRLIRIGETWKHITNKQ
jgi:HNH endonuclease